MLTPSHLYHITETKNVESIMSHGLMPALGALSSDAVETQPRIYLFDSIDSINHAYWFWEEMEDKDTPLTLLTVASAGLDLTPTFDGSDVSWEWSASRRIPPTSITINPDLQHIVA